MKKRQIILDFTSLLDVIMIILFFFIIFGKIETDEMAQGIEAQKEQLAAEHAEVQSLLVDADEKLAIADKTLAEAETVMDEANAAKERSGNNADAITEFGRNKNVKLRLTMTSDTGDWKIEVKKEDESFSIPKADSGVIADRLAQFFSESGYTFNDTILIEMIYNGNENGTNAAYQTIDKTLSELTKDYKHCFCSKTDMSDFSE